MLVGRGRYPTFKTSSSLELAYDFPRLKYSCINYSSIAPGSDLILIILGGEVNKVTANPCLAGERKDALPIDELPGQSLDFSTTPEQAISRLKDPSNLRWWLQAADRNSLFDIAPRFGQWTFPASLIFFPSAFPTCHSVFTTESKPNKVKLETQEQ